MADKAISELVKASQVLATDLFVLQQDGTAKCLPGQVLLNWLTAAADGHGGIQSIAKVGSSGLVDTYRITLADTTTFDYYVTNGRSIDSVQQTAVSGLTRTYTIFFNSGDSQTFTVTDGRSINRIEKTSTSGLVDTYTISFNDGTSNTFTVTNGAKGDKGDNTYVWIKYASQKPSEVSNSFGDLPDAWIGIYFGPLAAAPTDWTQYTWYKIEGERGPTGEPATLLSTSVAYQVGDSGTIIPSGSWSNSIPVVPQGKYLWTRVINTFNTGDPVISYSVSRMGLDGSGSVSSVANISPDENGNVPLTAENVDALPNTGGDLTGELRMNGQPISGLNAPTQNDHAANMGFVNQQMKKAAPRNLLDNSDFRNPVNQIGQTSYTRGYTIDRWFNISGGSVSVNNGYLTFAPADDNENQVWFEQKTENCEYLMGKTITVAVEYADGHTEVVNAVVSNNFSYMNMTGLTLSFGMIENGLMRTALVFRGNPVNLTNIALYEGEYTIDTLSEYQPKGYGAELAECQRYYKKFNVRTFGVATTGDKIVITYPLSPTMRANPTVNVDSCKYYNTTTWTYDELKGSEESIATGRDFAFIQFRTSSSIFTKGDIYIIHPLVMTVSADL